MTYDRERSEHLAMRATLFFYMGLGTSLMALQVFDHIIFFVESLLLCFGWKSQNPWKRKDHPGYSVDFHY